MKTKTYFVCIEYLYNIVPLLCKLRVPLSVLISDFGLFLNTPLPLPHSLFHKMLLCTSPLQLILHSRVC